MRKRSVLYGIVILTFDIYSVHSGMTKGVAPVNWPTFDWLGFQDVEASMTAFARECFCEYNFITSIIHILISLRS